MKVSVLMPVYNGDKCLNEAIESILSQSFTDFELLIINDASKDESENIIKSYRDPRIRYLKNIENKGLVETLNLGLQQSQGLYIARMDQDDICHPDRLKLQAEFLDSHLEIGVCGTGGLMFGGKNSKISIFESPENIAIQIIFNSPLIHPTVMLRKEILNKYNLKYDPLFSHAEDYAFWAELTKYTKLYNLPNVLINYRWHETNYSNTKFEEQRKIANEIRIKYIKDQLKISISESETLLHKKLSESNFINSESEVTDVINWLFKLYEANIKIGKFNEKLFNQFISFYWDSVIINSNGFFKSIKMHSKTMEINNIGKNNVRFYKLLGKKILKKIL